MITRKMEEQIVFATLAQINVLRTMVEPDTNFSINSPAGSVTLSYKEWSYLLDLACLGLQAVETMK